MRGVESHRREHRHQFAEEVVADPGRLGFVPVRAANEVDAVLGELGNDRLVEQFVLARNQRMRRFRDCPELLARRQAVGRTLGRVGADLFLEAGHAHLEEFVHVARDDAQEAQALQQGHGRIVCLRQHPALKGEYAELAVDEGIGAGQIHDEFIRGVLQ